jgi:exodeoxyribonuclease VII small subunit
MDPTPIAEMKFEVALAELEATVASMENGQFELAESIAAHRRGMALIQHCQNLLAKAEEEVRIIENGVARDVDRNTLEAQ